MRLSRLRVLSAAVIPLVFLAACGSEKTEVKAPSALDVITVAGPTKAPTLTFKTKPLSVKATTTKVITAGKGAKLTKANSIMFSYSLFNGKDGKQIETSFGKDKDGKEKAPVPLSLSSATVLTGLTKGLTGQLVGTRLLIAIPPLEAFGAEGNPQAGFGPTDTVVFFIEVISASTPLKTATGDPVAPKAGLPTVKVDAKGVPVVTIPKTKPSTTLVAQLLIKGKGPVVKSGQTLTAAYTGLNYRTGKAFDSSYTTGKLLEMPVGVGQLVPGFDKAIVGQTVGSRVLMVLPPAEGYGKAGNTAVAIKGTDTIVFIVDILAAA